MRVCVVGGGLAGSYAALLLASRGMSVRLYERRRLDVSVAGVADAAFAGLGGGSSMMEIDKTDKRDMAFTGRFGDASRRSINLALSQRGLDALAKVGLDGMVTKYAIPMRGRFIHRPDGTTELQPYSVFGEHIYSISRSSLNQWLLDAAHSRPEVEMVFGAKCSRVSRDGSITFDSREGLLEDRADLIIGADGAFSRVRDSMGRQMRLNYSREYADHGYKELSIPPTASGDFALPTPDALHIWPRHEFMLIALPNLDRSFTCTLFAPWDGPNGFNSIQSREDVTRLFQTHFPDVIDLIPDLLCEYFLNPASVLLTGRVSPLTFAGKVALVGDAAHAMVPFYGLGMNSALEDCVILDEIIEKHGEDNLAEALKEYSEKRVPAGFAIQDLSLDNYKTMRSRTLSRLWLWRQAAHKRLHRLLGARWRTQYAMVSFSNIPFDEIPKRELRQDRILLAGVIGAGLLIAGGLGTAIVSLI